MVGITKKLIALAILLMAPITGLAQTYNRSMLLEQKDHSIIAYPGSTSSFLPQGAVAPSPLQSLFKNMIQGMGVLSDNNTWTGLNTFSGGIAFGSFILPIVNGGTGSSTAAGVIAGANITVTGTFPNQTVSAAMTGGGAVESGTAESLAYYPATGTTVASANTTDTKTIGGSLEYTTTNTPLTLTVTVATASGSLIGINAAGQYTIPNNYIVADTTTPAAIPARSFIISNTGTGLQLNNSVQSGGVLVGDVLSFTPPSGQQYPCMKITGPTANYYQGMFFDQECFPDGWVLQYNGVDQDWILGTEYGAAAILVDGQFSPRYVPFGTETISFPSGFTMTNPSSNEPGQERWIDSGLEGPTGLVYYAEAQSGFTTSSSTISTYSCQSGPYPLTAGMTVIDTSISTGPISPSSVVGTISSCNLSTGLLTLTGDSKVNSAGANDILMGAVQATYQWGSTFTGAGLATQAIPVKTCTGMDTDGGVTMSDISLPTPTIIGSINDTECYNQIILTNYASQSSNGAADNLIFATPAVTSWTTSQDTISVATCTSIGSPQVVIDTTLSDYPNIGTISTCTSNILTLTADALHDSSGSTDALFYPVQATASWAIGAASVAVSVCPTGLPLYANLLDLTLSDNPVVATVYSCSGTTLIFNNLPTYASSGSSDRLIWAWAAYGSYTTSQDFFEIADGCGGVVPGAVVIDMTSANNPTIGTVSSCAFSGIEGYIVTLTSDNAYAVTAGDQMVFATPATSSFTTSDSTIPVSGCPGSAGSAVYDGTFSGLQYLGAAAGCGGLITLTSDAAYASSGSNDELIPAWPATASWLSGATSISVSSCTPFIASQYVVDLTLTTPTIIGEVSSCSTDTITLVSGAKHASSGSADSLTASTLSIVAESLIPAGGDYSWSNSVLNIPVPTCSGANPNYTVIDLSLSGDPTIGTIGVCSPTLLITYPALAASAFTQGYASYGSLDYLIFTQRRQGDYRFNQSAVAGGYAGWVGVALGTEEVPFGPIAKDTNGAYWSLGNYVTTAPVLISALPSCGSGLAPSGTTAVVSNGQSSPPYLGVVSTTGGITVHVLCAGTTWVYD